MKILQQPTLKKKFEKMYATRRNEILQAMLETDGDYKRLCQERTDVSMKLKRAISGTDADEIFEKYSDAVFAQDVYELDAVYKQGVLDALRILEEDGYV